MNAIVCLFTRREAVVQAVHTQRELFEAARLNKAKAREALDLLLISLYCHIPPSRGLEIRTLEILKEQDLDGPFIAANFRHRNITLLQDTGGVSLHLQHYKTWKFNGHEQMELEVRQLSIVRKQICRCLMPILPKRNT